MPIILTRSDSDNARTARELVDTGLEICSVPMIELRDVEIEPAELESLEAEVRDSTVLVTSAHAAERWLALRRTAFADDAPAHYLVVGASAARALAEGDPMVPVLAVVPMASALESAIPSAVRRLVYPCSTARRSEGIEIFRSRGIEVVEIPLYEPVLPAGAGARLADVLARTSPPHVIVFFSPSAVANWFSLRSDILPDSIFVAIGPTTADALRAHGVTDVTTATGTGGASLAEAIDRSLRRRA